jgi:hypothetical protein
MQNRPLKMMTPAVLVPVFLSLSLLVGCGGGNEPSRYDQVQQQTSQKGATAVSKEAQKGGSFNRVFPKSGAGYTVVPAQEKKGFAEYKLNQGGKTVAMLSINDTTGTSAADKYQQSRFSIAGYPAVDQGQNITGVLVGDRYQVKAQSRDQAFTKQDRVEWIEKFDLDRLSRLK